MILDEIVSKKEIRLEAIDKVKFKKLSKAEYSKNLFRNTFINNDFTVIGEFKKASPSKGIISEDFQIDKILKIYENPELVCDIKKNAKNTVTKKFNAEIMVKEYIKLFQGMFCNK